MHFFIKKLTAIDGLFVLTEPGLLANPLSTHFGDPSQSVVHSSGNWKTSSKTVVKENGKVVYESEDHDGGDLGGHYNRNDPFQGIGNTNRYGIPYNRINPQDRFNEFFPPEREPFPSGARRPYPLQPDDSTETTNPPKTEPPTTDPPTTSAPIVRSTPIERRTTPTVTNPSEHCEKSQTTVNGVPACTKSLIFESNFKNNLDRHWTSDIHFNRDESEFVVFDNNPVNVYCKSNVLNIEPTLLDDYYGENYTRTHSLDLTTKCTTREEGLCKREWFIATILPPVMSARITTKESFSFKYGVVEIKAKLPRGNWVIPEIWLQPKAFNPYGAKNSGRVVLAKSIGNSDLHHDGISIGNNLLYAGLEVNETTRKFRKMKREGLWSDQFHVYRLNWTPYGMKFSVDGESFGEWLGNKNSPLLEANGLSQEYGPVSPFDQEFYLLLGVHVGGYHDIPNGAVSGDQPKPWRNSDPKRVIVFYNDLKNWYKTWNDDTKLRVEYIKVWAL
ncbi:beta-1,3-glucan-binding protein isoform X2 [Nilaparvata lugens]|uniref:beta-1,3-glucan-binding protein isoform X2 n=1 Tax=Nilaparvata lugens TaxID=108931 RepID=UPI00193E5563|nr:beta-1,3-glucan-binding protein isoform X2 [Nilaparvata lugens]